MLEQLYYENEIKTNRTAARILEILAGLMIVCGFLSIIVYRKEVPLIIDISMIASGFVVHFACILISRMYYTKSYTKKLIITMVFVISALIFFYYPNVACFLVFGPILLSVKYYDKLFTKITSILTVIIFLLCSILNYLLEGYSPMFKAMHQFQGIYFFSEVRDFWIMLIIPKLCVISITALLCLSICRAGKTLVEKRAELSYKAEQMKLELETAAKIQEHTMPDTEYTTKDGSINLKAFIKPAKEVGGDLFDYFMMNKHIASFIIADISDKGLASAIYGARLKSACRYAYRETAEFGEIEALEDIDVAQIATIVNQGLCTNNDDNYFATVCMGCLDCISGELKYVNAGNGMPLIMHADGRVEELTNEPQMVLGLFNTAEYKNCTYRLEKGDCIFLYTDGVTDARNADDECFGTKRLSESIQALKGAPQDRLSELVINKVTEDVYDFIGQADQFDDITALAITYCGHNVEQSIETAANKAGVLEIVDRVSGYMRASCCPENFRRMMCTVMDEILVNISEYAYGDEEGYIKLRYGIDNQEMFLEFRDGGVEFNPLMSEAPDISGEPHIGGYGIFLVKQIADSVEYSYENNENILLIKKAW